jgi:hypothetical protein
VILKSNRNAIVSQLKGELRKRNEAAGILVEGAAKKLAPVDSGRLRSSISHISSDDEVWIGTNVSYAPHQEFGTINQSGTPFLVPGLLLSRAALMALYGKKM